MRRVAERGLSTINMSHESYASLSSALNAIGLTGQQIHPDQLVVSAQRGPVWPNRGNSFWLSLQSGTWYLSTWSPVCYRIPEDQDVVAVCLACAGFGTLTMYRVPEEITARFAMTQISDDEFDRLFPDTAE
jgi:hypothetical protein